MREVPTDCAGTRSAFSVAPEIHEGVAALIALIALCLFSLLGLYMMLSATGDLRISDNHESLVHARCAAQAGLNHARSLLRGLDFNDLLRGPDGKFDSSPSYIASARSFAFRNPLSWIAARSLNVFDPTGELSGLVDDGIISTGFLNGLPGTVLIPVTGRIQSVPNPYGSGTIIISRYFVKVSDNNGEPSELAGDPSDNPFVDGDGTVIVRSMGISPTIREMVGAIAHQNSMAVFEARFRRRSTFDLSSPLVVVANNINAAFAGDGINISGGTAPGIGTIDTNTTDPVSPEQSITLATGGRGSITGGGLPNPSVKDITSSVSLDSEKALLLDPNYLWNFVANKVWQAADYVYNGDQNWSAGNTPYLGGFDITKPVNDPAQDPRITFVNGNLSVSGDVIGAGLLVIRGDFLCSPNFTYTGLILVIGTGKVEAAGFNRGVFGAILVVNVSHQGGVPTFGTPSLSLSGDCNITANDKAVKMAIALLPPSQISYREVTSTMDP